MGMHPHILVYPIIWVCIPLCWGTFDRLGVALEPRATWKSTSPQTCLQRPPQKGQRDSERGGQYQIRKQLSCIHSMGINLGFLVWVVFVMFQQKNKSKTKHSPELKSLRSWHFYCFLHFGSFNIFKTFKHFKTLKFLCLGLFPVRYWCSLWGCIPIYWCTPLYGYAYPYVGVHSIGWVWLSSLEPHDKIHVTPTMSTRTTSERTGSRRGGGNIKSANNDLAFTHWE
jgi:hypothetical protein